MNQQFLKITYHLGAKKMNAYIKMPSPTYFVLKKEIEICLFEDRNQPRCEIRTFWIDDDKDEIEILNQCDYEIFMAKTDRKHLQVAPVGCSMDVDEPAAATAETIASKDSQSNETKVPPADGSYDYAVHSNIECDSCLMAPIIGFRYKCIQCANYDLCQNCESKHIHPEHMMVRMPTNNCPTVIEASVTGRSSGRRHRKHSKTSCPFIKNGISVAIDDDNDMTSTIDGENVQQSSTSSNRERRHARKNHRQNRNNFFSHLYEMMHDLAEGGGVAAAAHAMGESDSSSKATTFNNGTQTNASNAKGFGNEETPIAAATAAAAAHIASQYAEDAATKAAEIAAKVASETASNVAKNIAEHMAATAGASTSAAANENAEEKKATSEENVEASAPPREARPQAVPVVPSPSLDGLVQFLDPQYMKTGIQILNNFSDMFAKMLDPVENDAPISSHTTSNLQKDSSTSNKTSISSNLNSLGSEKKPEEEKSLDKNQTQENIENNTLSTVEIDDLGSESENESVSDTFVKLNVPKSNESSQYNSSASADTTPPKSLDKSNVMDFAQLSANLKAHIDQEGEKESLKSNENAKTADETPAASVSGTVTVTPPTTVTTTTSNKSEETRAVPVYHADQRINNSVLAMMSMGFSNEGAWLTQLLESVNGSIPEALDIMSAAQRHNGR